VSDSEVRLLLEELAAPSARDVATPAPGAPTLAQQLDRVVVGRRRQRRLDLRLAHGSITEAQSRAYVLGMFSDVTPTGAAQAVDTQLGAPSPSLRNAACLPRTSVRSSFSPPVTIRCGPTRCCSPAWARSTGLTTMCSSWWRKTSSAPSSGPVDDFATVLIGGASGRTVGSTLQRLLQGFVRGLLDADQAQDFRRVSLCEMNDEQYEAIKRELYRLASTSLFAEVEVTFEEVKLRAPAEPEAPARGLAAFGPAPIYFMVRQEQAKGGRPEFQASLLTAGSKATVIVSRKSIEAKALDRLLAQIGTPGFTPAKLEALGQKLAGLVLAEDMARCWRRCGNGIWWWCMTRLRRGFRGRRSAWASGRQRRTPA